MKILVRAVLNATESFEKVLESILNIFDFEKQECRVVAEHEKEYVECIAHSTRPLLKFRHLLRQQRILDAARSCIERGLESAHTTFLLNKQAAFMGKISFCSYETGESPMGPITVAIDLQTCNPEVFMNWLSPRTVSGKPVDEIAELNC
ncbi:MAG: hypothetical protein LM590_09030 [Thermofilum sp.]|jgi:predicted RNA binding protein with dsRBD fold (UPF0201 family)|nr:hypothetical protein [Thermofilum sp.]